MGLIKRADFSVQPDQVMPTAATSTTRPEIIAVYRVRCDAARIEARARDIAVEQSVEMPLDAIDDAFVASHIVGRVHEIIDRGDGTFSVHIGLNSATVGRDAGQLMNMLFGNTSIHADVVLEDAHFPAEFSEIFGGPNIGLDGLRARAGAGRRALTCSALKPQGLPPEKLGDVAHRLALGGLDYIKDDHGLADQAFSPFAQRVKAVAAAVSRANSATGRTCQYVPSLCGSLDDMRAQVRIARDQGVAMLLIAPMVAGVANFRALVRDNRDMAFLAHPALAGPSHISPPLHFGKIFRMLGADGVIFPNFGGRFGYSEATCRSIAREAAAAWAGMLPAVPVPAGGMTLERVDEILACYGADTMLLIGGALLSARERITEAAAAFTEAVEEFGYGG